MINEPTTYELELQARVKELEREVEYQNERWAHERMLHGQTRKDRDRLRELLAFVLADADPDSVCVLYEVARRALEGSE